MTPRESRKQRSALWRDFHIDFPGEWNIASRSSIPPWVLKPLPYCFGKSILYPPWMQAEIESGRLAQGGFAANTTLVVRRWFGCGFAAPWGRPSFLVVCLWQGRVEKPPTTVSGWFSRAGWRFFMKFSWAAPQPPPASSNLSLREQSKRQIQGA